MSVLLRHGVVFASMIAFASCSPTSSVDEGDTSVDGDGNGNGNGGNGNGNGNGNGGDTDTGLTDTGDTDAPYPWPTLASDYRFDKGTYIDTINIPGPKACCRDWMAKSKLPGIDNALGSLNALLGLSGIDFNSELTAVLTGGDFVALLDHRGVPAGDGPYTMGFFLGGFDQGTDYATAVAGDGKFLVDPQSFVLGTGTPQVVFNRAEKTGGSMSASGGLFTISLAFQGVNLDLPVSDVRIDGDIELVQGKGVKLSNGELSGYVKMDDFVDTYNDIVNSTCSCAGVQGNLLQQNGQGAWTGGNRCMTNADVEAACPAFDQYICEVLIGKTVNVGQAEYGLCDLLPGMIELSLDIDTDGNANTYEALSVGVQITGQPAKAVGLLP